MPELATVSAKRLAELNQGEPVDLIDVRTPVEFREVHAAIAQNIPLDALDPATLLKERTGAAGKPLYVICHKGGRSAQACEMLRTAGHQNIVDVSGGTAAWVDAGLPVNRGRKAISLERQVRIAAGFLVVVGAFLALLSPYFLILPAFVGAGLMFAGITDSCGMGMMLAKMPWNQVKEDEQCCSVDPSTPLDENGEPARPLGPSK